MDAILELGLLNGVLVAGLAVMVAIVTCVCRRPALAHALWLLVLIKLITPPLVPLEVPWPQPIPAQTKPVVEPLARATAILPSALDQPEEPLPDLTDVADEAVDLPPLPEEGDGAAAPFPDAAEPSWSIPWQTAVAALWLTGACCWWCLAAWRLFRFRRLLRAARPASPGVQARAQALAGRLGLTRCPSVRLLPAPLPPLLWSLLGPPCVFLPERLWANLPDEQQDTLLAHELAHLQRRDHWVRWLELLALGLYWWHPAAWWARRALHDAEELLCDARVLRTLPGAAEAYAQALVQTVAFLSGPRLALPGAASGLGHVRPLKARLVMIMRGTNADRLPRASAWALAALGLALLVLRPEWAPSAVAQTPDTAPVAPSAEKPALVPDKAGNPGRGDRVRSPDEAGAPAAPGRPGPAVGIGSGFTGSSGGSGFTGSSNGAGFTGSSSGAGFTGRAANTATSEAQEQVELLRAQLAGKQAELQEARVHLKLAQKRLKRMDQMIGKGVVGQEDLDQARGDVEVQEARVQGKEAQMREAQLRLAVAARRAAQPRQTGQKFGGGTAAPIAGYPGSAGPQSESRPPDRGGNAPSPATPEGMRPPGSYRPAKQVPVPGGPAVPPPTSSGTQVRRVQALTNEERLLLLERRLDDLLREVQALRRQMAPSQNRGGGGSGDSATRRQTPAADQAQPTPNFTPQSR